MTAGTLGLVQTCVEHGEQKIAVITGSGNAALVCGATAHEGKFRHGSVCDDHRGQCPTATGLLRSRLRRAEAEVERLTALLKAARVTA